MQTSDALMLKAFVNCKYMTVLMMQKSNAFLLEVFVNCKCYTWIYVFFSGVFLCCSLMIGYMAHSVHSDFQMDDCNISLFISDINPFKMLNLHLHTVLCVQRGMVERYFMNYCKCRTLNFGFKL